LKSTRSNSILDFIENSKHSTIAQSLIIEFARSIFVLHFVLRSSSASQMQFVKSSILNSKLTSFDQFTSRFTISSSENQTTRTTMKYEISKITFTVESISEMSQEFIETQRRELMIMMQEFWAQRFSFFASFAASFFSQTLDSRSERWVSKDLKFFDSTYDEKFTTIDDTMQLVDKNTYFRNVHLFIDRVKNIIVIKTIDVIRNNLYICLRDTIMTWYTTELFEKTKELVKTSNNLDVWKRYLIKRFRDRSNVIMIIIIRERYIMKNARRRRESRKFVSVIMKATRSTKLKSKTHQIMMIYNDLNLEFQRDISMSTLITQIQNFLQHLDDKKNIW
jgi:hypothetical protein